MNSFVALSMDGVVSFAAVNSDIQNYLRPIMFSLIGLAGVVSAFFIVQGGIEYMSSSGKPEKLEHAKQILKNALVGLALVIAAGTLTAILTSAYQDAGASTLENVPSLIPVAVEQGGGGITEVLINAIIGLFKHVIATAATPFISALDYFTHSTPLIAENPAVFKLWLTTLGIANALFVSAIALIGFQYMSAASFGLEEASLKQLLPKLVGTFLLMNMSIFAIDAIISLSNAMIGAVENAYSSLSVWDALSGVVDGADSYGLVSLLVMIVFLVLATILLVYYVLRIVILYVGAILAPVAALLQIIPGFKDFFSTALKTYVTIIFVLFVHVIILTLSATLFEGIRAEGSEQPFDPVMATVIGVAALIALLKTQNAMQQMAYVSVGPKAIRTMTKQFMNGVAYSQGKFKSTRINSATNTSTASASKRPVISNNVREIK